MSINIVEDGELKKISGGDIESISVNGANVPLDSNKNVNIIVPTKTSQLTNDSDFVSTDALDEKADAYNGTSNFVEFARKIGTAIPDGVGGISTNGPIKLVNGNAEALTVDQTPSSGSKNLVTSGGVYSALQNAGGAGVEEGTWTPKYYTGTTVTPIGRNSGRYYKFGNLVYCIAQTLFNNSSYKYFDTIEGFPFVISTGKLSNNLIGGFQIYTETGIITNYSATVSTSTKMLLSYTGNKPSYTYYNIAFAYETYQN